MKFDVIIGNPPYQMNDGGGVGASSIPIYQSFVEKAKKLNPRYMVMITPSRWFAGGKGLNEFRKNMLNSSQIVTIVDFRNSADCFPGVNIAGGVNYFLWSKEYKGECKVINKIGDKNQNVSQRKLNEFEVFVRDNIAIDIIRKVKKLSKSFMDNLVYSRNCFEVESKYTGHSLKQEGDISLYSLKGKSYVSYNEFVDKEKLLDKYKVIMTKAMSGGNKPTSDGKYLVISNTMKVLEPKEICTETYLCVGNFLKKENAENLKNYIKTKFFRFLLLQALSSINISKEKFQFVPVQDFSKSWTDEQLYKKYNLSQDEINYIEKTIRPMELPGGVTDGK